MKNKKAVIFRLFLLLTLMILLNGCDEESGLDDTADATDKTPPEIALLGANPFELSTGNTFTDPGATATDDVDGDISANIMVGGDTVDITTPGTYALTYDVSDAAGNAASQVTRTVVVSDGTADTAPPVITLLGANPFELSTGNTFTDPGATATDDVDGDISANIMVGGDTVDITTPGTYALTYDVSDAAGNAASQVTRTVVVSDGTADTTPPVITLLGDNPIEIDIASGAAFTDPGATATDNVDGDISASIVVGGDTVDTTTLGTYVVTYDVSDAAGNAASQVTRNVVVIDGDDAKIPTSFSWTAPTENSDGSNLTDLSLYRLYYGPDTSSLQMIYEFSAGGSSLNFSSIPQPEYENLVNLISQNTTHFYAITAVNGLDIESDFSNIVEF
ncbi:MAG: DUF5011 domain-containing protein [Candidatus Thiodiazotropha sp.]